MKSNDSASVVVIVIGIVLLILGFNEYGTFGSRAGRLFGAGPSNKVLFLSLQAQRALLTDCSR